MCCGFFQRLKGDAFMVRGNVLCWILVSLGVMVLSGCGNGILDERESSFSNAPGIGSEWGAVAVSGARMDIPAYAVDEGVTFNPLITLEDMPPALAPDGGLVAGKTVVITGLPSNLYAPASVTVSYDPGVLGPDDVPSVFYYDALQGGYSPVSVRDVDDVSHTLVFTTTHDGKFVPIGIRGLSASLGISGSVAAPKRVNSKAIKGTFVDTRFRPSVDGFFHPNFGAYDSPGGSCLGMANYSVWYFGKEKKSNRNTGLYSMYKDGDPARWEDDLTARELISRAYMASSQSWANTWMQRDYLLGPGMTGYLMIMSLKLSGPLTFLMGDQWPGMTAGHATVVYKYDAGKFYVYDNNFPGEETTIDWGVDPWTSDFAFSNFTKNDAYFIPFTQFAFVGYATYAEPVQYKKLYEDSQSGWDVSKFNTITVTSAVDSDNNKVNVSTDGTIELTGQDMVILQGILDGGIKRARFVVCDLNDDGRYSGDVKDGEFVVEIPWIFKGVNTLTMVATDDRLNAWNAYGGFMELTIIVL
jgi:hypothetical protein